MPRITSNTLIITGEHDALPIKNSYVLSKGVTAAKLEIIEKCGHFPFFEVPEVFQDLILTWLIKKSQ